LSLDFFRPTAAKIEKNAESQGSAFAESDLTCVSARVVGGFARRRRSE